MIPPSPCSFAQWTSATAWSMSLERRPTPEPARRPGVAAAEVGEPPVVDLGPCRPGARVRRGPSPSNGSTWNGRPFGNSTSATTPALEVAHAAFRVPLRLGAELGLEVPERRRPRLDGLTHASKASRYFGSTYSRYPARDALTWPSTEMIPMRSIWPSLVGADVAQIIPYANHVHPWKSATPLGLTCDRERSRTRPPASPTAPRSSGEMR